MKVPAGSLVKRLGFYAGVYMGKPFLEALFALNREITVNKRSLVEALGSGKSVILCCWHGRLLFPFYFFRNSGGYAVAGHHEDAEIIARMGEKMGWGMIRGSSTEGGAGAFQEIVQVLSKEGTMVAITPDGPRGPRKRVKAGAVKAAMRTGAVIIPMSGQASRKREFTNWDTFVVPKAMGRVSFVFGNPIEIGTEGDVDGTRRELERELNRVQDIADAAVVKKT